jgi:hypothetical protein
LQLHNRNFFKFIKNLLLQTPISKDIFNEADSQKTQFYSGFRYLEPSRRLLFINLMGMLHRLIEFVNRSVEPDEELVKQIAAYLSLLYFAVPDMAEIYFLSIDMKRHL